MISRRIHIARAFTLLELLVAMGIIALLATITIFSVRGLSRDAKLSSGVNTLTAVLGEARALAMKNNAIVMVVFRPNWDPQNPTRRQFTEAIIAQWTGESALNGTSVVDRFVAVDRVLPRPLPAGIKIAGPFYATNNDDFWVTQTELRLAAGEQKGEVIGVMYGPDGSTMTRNPQSDSNRSWIDMNRDGLQRRNGTNFSPVNPTLANFFDHTLADDEPYIDPVPFVAVYDDEQARESGNPSSWNVLANYETDLTGPNGFINRFANRIHFNRYTGVAMATRGPGG